MMLDEARERDGGGGANVFAYTAAISACGKAGQWEKAISLLDVRDGVPHVSSVLFEEGRACVCWSCIMCVKINSFYSNFVFQGWLRKCYVQIRAAVVPHEN